MKLAHLWLRIYAAGFLICVALLIVSVLTPISYGDLTRVGRISESAFGWRKELPAIDPVNLKDSPLADADIVVVGDSFSLKYAWQSVLIKAGYRVTTTHWDRTGALCTDFGNWLLKSGFHGKLVIIESVERLLPERLAALNSCSTMQHSFESIVPTPPSSRTPPKFALNWNAKLMSGAMTFKNTRDIKNATGVWNIEVPDWGYAIAAHPLPEGCRQFSNHMCEKGLFLIPDENYPRLTSASVAAIQRFEKSAAPWQVMWMVIPNKETVYVKPDHGKDFTPAFNQARLGPDLFAFAEQQRLRIVDLYEPNDTHLSISGYLAFGERMLQAVRNTLAPRPAAALPATDIRAGSTRLTHPSRSAQRATTHLALHG